MTYLCYEIHITAAEGLVMQGADPGILEYPYLTITWIKPHCFISGRYIILV